MPDKSSTFDTVTPRAVLTWYPNDELTVYTSYSEGFRSGYDQTPRVEFLAPGFPPVEEDSLRNYEVGAKGNLLDGRLIFDAALYFIDWQDVQQTILVPAPGSRYWIGHSRCKWRIRQRRGRRPGFNGAAHRAFATGPELQLERSHPG